MIRPAGPDDLGAIEKLATGEGCFGWGGLKSVTAQLLEARWRKPNFTEAFIQVVETERGLQGYADVYQITPNLIRSQGVSTDLAAAAALINWTLDKAASQDMRLQTSLSSKDEGSTLFASFVDHPLYSLLVARGFRAFSTTRVMRLVAHRTSDPLTLPSPYQLVDYSESLLSSLMVTYYAAWPEDYYENESRSSIEEIFREAQTDDLRLVIAGDGDVVGYVLTSRTTEYGAIDEVAVNPSHRRKGLGEFLTQWAIRSLGDRTITLVVMDENPARYLYEKLGFVIWDERLDLAHSGK